MDPWLKDDPSKPKIFALAGFLPILGETVQLQKAQIIQKLKSLGGRYVEKDEWDPSVTHVIAYVDNEREGMSEKVMAAIAAGRWVLTKRYVEKSFKARQWIEAPGLFAYPGDIVLRSRKKWFLQGVRGGPFWDMKAALVMEGERKKEVYGRIIVAGGGTVEYVHTLRQLAEDPTLLTEGQLTHVFLDTGDVATDSFRNVKSQVDREGLRIWFLPNKFLFLKVGGRPEPTEEEYSLMTARVRDNNVRSVSPIGAAFIDRRVEIELEDDPVSEQQDPLATTQSRNNLNTTIDLTSSPDDSQNMIPQRCSTVPPSSPSLNSIQCPVCLETLATIISKGYHPLSTTCGHIFCSYCLPECIRLHSHCPTCRQKLAKGQYHQLFIH